MLYSYTIIALFFASLAAIAFMIGRKLALINNGKVVVEERVMLAPFLYFKEFKYHLVKNLRKYGHITLIALIRSYIKLTNFLKKTYQELEENITRWIRETHIKGERKEISKFLKVIGDYKQKIRDIKHKIKEEENL